jgi:hypothetical protein
MNVQNARSSMSGPRLTIDLGEVKEAARPY